MTHLKQIPTNAPNGVAFTLTAHQGGIAVQNLTQGGGYYPTTGVIVITDAKVNRNKPLR